MVPLSKLIKFGRTWKHIVSFLIVYQDQIGPYIDHVHCAMACKKGLSRHNTVTKTKGGLPFLRHEPERGFTLLLEE